MPQLPPPPPSNPDQDLQYNIPLYGVRGEFSLTANVTVPYFMTLMDLKRLTRELKSHEEVSPSLETIYSLVELFQRKIDEKRVRREIVDGYLKAPSKLKFFNSLTIVLLPRKANGEIESEFVDYPNNDPVIPYEHGQEFDAWFAQEGAHRCVFGGVQFVATDSANLSRLRWDGNRVEAVAVDGQHRLRALKLWIQERNNQLSEVESPTRVPIIFLLLHEKAGFKRPVTSGPSGIKPIAREIFTDLNKNAREVDLATEIVLDDRSIESCCVRALVTSATCTDSNELLPLSLLRWREANNRFDQGYFLNSLVNLHLLVGDLLSLNPPKNPMDPSDAKEFIKKATSLLGVGDPPAIRYDNITLGEFYEQEFLDPLEKENAVAPFSGIPSQFLNAAVEGFRVKFSEWLLRILRDFKPYRDLICYARKQNLIEGEFAQYLSQPDGHQETLTKVLEERHGDRWRHLVIGQHVTAIEGLKGLRIYPGDQWPFKTIFQKAFVRLGKVLFVDTPLDQRSKFGNVDDFLRFFDRLYEFDVLRVKVTLSEQSYDLWTFIAVNYGSGKIKVSATSEKRIEALLRLWYFAWRFAEVQGKALVEGVAEEGRSDTIGISDIATAFAKKGIQPEWPVNDAYAELERLFVENAHIVCGKPNREDVPDVKKRDVARARIRLVLSRGLKPWIGQPDPEDQGI